MKKIFKKFILVIFCMIFIKIAATSIFNHILLANLKYQLSNYPIPAQTIVMEEKSAYGSLMGQSDNMSYLTVLLVKSSLSKEDLQAHYQRTSFKTVLSARTITKLTQSYGETTGKEENEQGTYFVDIYINNVTGNELNMITDRDDDGWDTPLNKELTFKSLNGMVDYSNYYYIMLYDGMYPEHLDVAVLNVMLDSIFR